MNQIDLQGKVALLTGGSGGIGTAVAERLRASGATVVTWDLHKSADANVDLTSEQAVQEAADGLIARYSRVDILINCAGITGPTQRIEDYAVSEWHRTIEVNLTATYLCCRALVPHMRQRDIGRIVNLASIAGKEGNALMTAYSAAKGAVIAFTKALGKELADTGVRVNCVAPAVIETKLVEQMSSAAYQAALAKIPMGRMGQPKEVAAMIAWLVSDECSFSTGACFDLSGGRATY